MNSEMKSEMDISRYQNYNYNRLGIMTIIFWGGKKREFHSYIVGSSCHRSRLMWFGVSGSVGRGGGTSPLAEWTSSTGISCRQELQSNAGEMSRAGWR
jgi:hypothetical protein